MRETLPFRALLLSFCQRLMPFLVVLQSTSGAIVGRWVPSEDANIGGNITGEVVVDTRAAAAGRTTVPMVIFKRFDTISKSDWTLWSVGHLLANGSIHASWVNNHGELATAMMTRMNESERTGVVDMGSPVPPMQPGSAADFNASWTVSGGDGQIEAPFTSLHLWQTERSGEAGYLAGSCTAESTSSTGAGASCVVLRGQYLNTTGPKQPPFDSFSDQIGHVDISIADLTFAVVFTLCTGRRGAGQWIDTAGRAGKLNLCRASGCTFAGRRPLHTDDNVVAMPNGPMVTVGMRRYTGRYTAATREFLGIEYAQQPTEALRWFPAQSLLPLSTPTTIDAGSRFGPM